MKTRFLLAGLLCATTLTIAPSVLACPACADKSGVPFTRIHTGHYASQIVLFARPDSELRSFNRRADLRFLLERSGHSVHLIGNDQDLEDAIRAKRTDLVLAEPADAAALRARLADDSAAPLVLSLTTTSTAAPDADLVRPNCRLQATVNQSKNLVQTIESYIGNRQAGRTIRCAPSDG